MSYSDLIEKIKTLPDAKQAEVFDFVDYLTTRFALHTDSDLTDWSDQEFANLSMQQALRGIEADPVIYTDADLRERWG
ncbi:Protein of unknown function [Allochromatium warmingii]|uniref:DUF2281 domain-containing protein n=1 Tax=Allochromatium warmingii TaxID=61595 RepID=A0A1H3II48_ALLWA|nr:DUF2281 domain-containing protein [Allochromatium warmingii]SDY26504.1 Protein of unknown function [Allochromatium warmingii]